MENWLVFSIIALIVFLALVFTLRISKKHKKGPDYYALFIIGIVWLIIGIPLENVALWTLGLIFFIVGVVNKDKWKSNRIHWKDISKKEKKIRIWIMIALGIFIIIGLVVLLLIM